ncbi:putative beta-adaptin-like protein [Neospora caninum Liverpool]|uniref:Putative beta-adaptin-like protein n=1 Tax=Neospora caninum (strain Liverpool) TaxID=572307 RepID=F0VBA4_NEOCL|nr:putative beta-adaptin-like protein [Neospora caninum Liverpool]CBZ50888.1 putative beta-adaptin-like protein [Neospora caninum Liverpool]|eukprot:XP_003880921.1 putative beta-adaptin-like protein [Neospora caninum Liverpool]
MASVPPPAPPPPPALHAGDPRPPAGPQFFVDQKRGELYELRQVLRSLPTERDVGKQRDALKKLIAYMTVGLDVSRLFADVVMLASTADLVQKKMIYQYLTNYADTNPSLSLLAINTFQKDCNDEDPRLRGLALRSLCSLRLSCMLEYIEPAARKGMADASPYVRRAAVMGMLKVCKLLQEVMSTDEESTRQRIDDIRQRLDEALFDDDPQVAINAVCALNEVDAETGGLQVTKKIATHFLNRIKRFSEWGVCVVLNLVASYQPETEEETFDIMNILDDKLTSSSAAVVLGCSNCFLELTRGNDELRRQVYRRLKPPLLTLATTGYPEIAHTILRHILLIVQTGGPDAVEVFAGESRQLFCRYTDPSYLKSTKLQTLTAIATERNCVDMIAELREYVCDADADIARQSLAALGVIACKIPSAADDVVTLLLSFVEMEVADFLASAAFVILRDILRKYTKMISRLVDAIRIHALRLSDGEGVAAVVWMIGEFAKDIDDAAYILEEIVDRFEEEPTIVRLELLTAAAKSFFHYPGEMQPILGKLLEKETRRILSTPLPPADELESSAERELADRLLEEFNSLAVVYRLPSSAFLSVSPIPFGGKFSPSRRDASASSTNRRTSSQALLDGGKAGIAGKERERAEREREEREREEREREEREAELIALREGDFGDRGGRGTRQGMSSLERKAGRNEVGDLLLALDTDAGADPTDRKREDSPPLGSRDSPVSGFAASVPDRLRLTASVTLDSAMFQRLWEEADDVQTLNATHATPHFSSFLSVSEDFEALGEAFEAAATQNNIFTMASGVLGDVLKMFFYGKDEDGILYLCEMQLTLTPLDVPELNLTVKAATEEASDSFLSGDCAVRREQFAAALREALDRHTDFRGRSQAQNLM